MGKVLKTVDIIRPGSINAIIGPVGTLKRMLKNQDYFHSRGYDVTVFTNESITIGPIKNPPMAKLQVRPSSLKSRLRRKIGSLLRMRAKKSILLSKWFLGKDFERTEKLVDYYISLERTPDIIEFHSDLECFLYLKKRRENKAKTVMFLHSDGIPFKMTLQYYPKLEGSAYLKQMREDFAWTVEHTDRIVFIAKTGRTNFLQLYPQRSLADTSVIINGIDDLTDSQIKEVDIIKTENANSTFKYRLCCTGTINTRKGHRIIIEALHRLPSALLEQVHVDFMGDGGERPVLESLVKDYGLNNHVMFYGLIPNIDVYKYLAKNNIYILMSKNEGLPISIIEAMRAGLPIISTNVSGIPELINPEFNGFLLNPDVEELTSLLNDLPKYDWKAMGENSRKRFEKEFTFERMEREFCDMFNLVYDGYKEIS